jgi:hypothetical protein
VLEGAFLLEVGTHRYRLALGDALLAPRQIPHGWANVSAGNGRLLTALLPAGAMEAFFGDMSTVTTMAPPDPERWRRYGLEWSGPPLPLEPTGPEPTRP